MLLKSRSVTWIITTSGLVGLAGLAGCSSDRPHEVGRERPAVGDLDRRDRGQLQSRDLLEASDLMTQSLVSLPELNESRSQWTIVTSNVENETTRRQNYDIFIDRLRTNLSKQARGRIRLIENKQRFHDLQSKELETGNNDQFGQGSGASGLPAGIQPDFVLYGKMQELPNRGTSTYRMEFNLTNFHTREQVWSDEYIVKVAR
jgi:hypothetical protein